MLREAQRALTLAVFVSGILGVLIYPGADALMEFLFCDRITREVITSTNEESRTSP